MAGFLRDFLQGASQAVPGAVESANQYEQQARTLAQRDEAHQLQKQAQAHLEETQRKQEELQSINLTMQALKNPNKQQQKAMFDFLVKKGDMTQDFADMTLKSSDDARAEAARKISDGDISIEDILFFRKSNMEDLIPVFAGLENSKSDRELQNQQARKTEVETKVLNQQLLQQSKLSETISNIFNKEQASATIDNGGNRQASTTEIQRLTELQKQFLAAGNTKTANDIGKLINNLNPKKDISIQTDNLGNLIRIDNQTGKRLSLDLSAPNKQVPETGNVTGEELIDKVSRPRRSLLITPAQTLIGSGAVSNVRQLFNNVFGMFIPGQIAPETEEAKNAIKSFNQMVKAGLTINSRNPIAELQTIQGFLLDEDKIFVDPDANITKLINIVKRLESTVIKGQNMLNNRTLSKEMAVETSNNVNAALGLLEQIPTVVQLKIQGGKGIDVEDVDSMSIDAIEAFPEDYLTREVAQAMINRMKILLKTK